MGSKRVGLARTQALIENLKRELNLEGTRLRALDVLFGSNKNSVDGSPHVGAADPDIALRFYSEEVSLVGLTPNDTDNAVLAYLSKKFDGNAIIKDV